jgi:hypothetical protein
MAVVAIAAAAALSQARPEFIRKMDGTMRISLNPQPNMSILP